MNKRAPLDRNWTAWF